MLSYVKDNPEIPIAPDYCSFEHFKDVRDAQGTGKYSDEYTALIGFCASYCGGYFPKGYARGNDNNGNPRNMYYERVKNLRKQAPNLKGIDFYCGDYLKFKTDKFQNALFYLDPPYKDTTQYDGQKINYTEFYDFCKKLSKNNIVLISEYNMPEEFTCIWQKERKVMFDSTRHEGIKTIEKLFKI